MNEYKKKLAKFKEQVKEYAPAIIVGIVTGIAIGATIDNYRVHSRYNKLQDGIREYRSTSLVQLSELERQEVLNGGFLDYPVHDDIFWLSLYNPSSKD